MSRTTLSFFLRFCFPKGLLYCLLFFIQPHIYAQEKKDSIPVCKMQYKFSIPGQFSFVTVDQSGFIYAISQSGSFIKYNATGDSVTAYNNIVRYGKPVRADVANPFKMLLYYRRLPGCTLLDRQLNEQGAISFQKSGLVNVAAMATSYDNRIWLFDQQRSTLKKMDDDGTLLLESNDFRQLTGTAIRVEKILEGDGAIYLYDPNYGFVITDYYGNYQTQLPLLQWSDVGRYNQRLYGRMNDVLYLYDRASFRCLQWKLPNEFKYTSVFISAEKIYFTTETELKVFSLIPGQF